MTRVGALKRCRRAFALKPKAWKVRAVRRGRCFILVEQRHGLARRSLAGLFAGATWAEATRKALSLASRSS